MKLFLQTSGPPDSWTSVRRVSPVEVSFDPLLDEPQRVVRLVLQVEAHLGQDLRRDVGEVVAGVGVAQQLDGVLANHRLQGVALGAEPPGRRRAAAGPELREQAAEQRAGPEPAAGEERRTQHHDEASMELERNGRQSSGIRPPSERRSLELDLGSRNITMFLR